MDDMVLNVVLLIVDSVHFSKCMHRSLTLRSSPNIFSFLDLVAIEYSMNRGIAIASTNHYA